MAGIALHGLEMTFDGTRVLHGIDLEVADGEFVVRVGPSGCGKSTTLRLVAGLEDPSAGEIVIGGRVVNHLEPKARDVAMVFQNDAIYPHMTVRQNIAFGLRAARMPRADEAARVEEVASFLEMTALLSRKPAQLSGGQRQRVAIGRAMLLFNEPLSNLDAQLRTRMRLEIKRLHQRVRSSIVFVTHDPVEAMTMADRTVIMRDGRIQQVGTPEEVYRHPADAFVGRFIGAPAMDMLAVRAEGGALALPGGGRLATGAADGPVTLGVRPEDLRATGGSGEALVEGRVALREPLGGETLIHLDGEDGGEVVAEIAGRSPPALGAHLRLGADPADLHLFDPDSAAALR